MGVSLCYQPAVRASVYGVLILSVLFGSCQSEQTTLDVQTLEQRVESFWEARIQGDDLSAYTYESYAYTGEMTAAQYAGARAATLKYKAYSIDAIDKHENKAQVKVTVEYQLYLPAMGDVPLSMKMDEDWELLEDGRWYRQVRPRKPGQGLRDQGT